MPSRAVRSIVLYDGVCGLCDRLVQFVLRRDRYDRFRFAALQGGFAVAWRQRQNLDPGDLSTVYVVVDAGGGSERLLAKSRAILHILEEIGGPWRLAGVLRILPARVLDGAYDVVARHRYRIFGKHDVCMAPAPERRSKFLDG